MVNSAPQVTPFLRPAEIANFYRALDTLFSDSDQNEALGLACSDETALELMTIVCGSFGHRLGQASDVGRVVGETATALSRLARYKLGSEAFSCNFGPELTKGVAFFAPIRPQISSETLRLKSYLKGEAPHPGINLLSFYCGVYLILRAMEESDPNFDVALELELTAPRDPQGFS